MGQSAGVAVWPGGSANRRWGVAQTEAARMVYAVAANTKDCKGATCRGRPVMYIYVFMRGPWVRHKPMLLVGMPRCQWMLNLRPGCRCGGDGTTTGAS